MHSSNILIFYTKLPTPPR